MAGEIINRLNVGHVVNVKLTDDDAVNGQNFIDAYNYAKTLTPNGQALSTTNRVAVILQPGNYLLTAQFTIDTQFVDIIGLGAQKLERGAIPAVNITGNTLNVTANDVRVKGISVGLQTFFVVNNLSLLIIEDCVGTGLGSFAGSFSGSTGIASGTFINCIGGPSSFGCGAASSGIASGTFINCTGGSSSFGGNSSGVASGVFINCTGLSGQSGGSFGGGFLSGIASGTFTNCIGGYLGFGGGTSGVASGKFYQCRLTSGTFKTVSDGGLMRNCIDGNNDIVDQ